MKLPVNRIEDGNGYVTTTSIRSYQGSKKSKWKNTKEVFWSGDYEFKDQEQIAIFNLDTRKEIRL